MNQIGAKSPFPTTPVTISRGNLPIEAVAGGDTRRFWVELVPDQLGGWHRVPVIVRRGVEPGPTVVVTAVVHGNELNGMRAVHELLASPAAAALRRGSLVAVPVVNIPGYLRHERAFADGKDLNRYVAEDDDELGL